MFINGLSAVKFWICSVVVVELLEVVVVSSTVAVSELPPQKDTSKRSINNFLIKIILVTLVTPVTPFQILLLLMYMGIFCKAIRIN